MEIVVFVLLLLGMTALVVAAGMGWLPRRVEYRLIGLVDAPPEVVRVPRPSLVARTFRWPMPIYTGPSFRVRSEPTWLGRVLGRRPREATYGHFSGTWFDLETDREADFDLTLQLATWGTHYAFARLVLETMKKRDERRPG
jgi:hypothetical protein